MLGFCGEGTISMRYQDYIFGGEELISSELMVNTGAIQTLLKAIRKYSQSDLEITQKCFGLFFRFSRRKICC
jgi:hypothetical protein